MKIISFECCSELRQNNSSRRNHRDADSSMNLTVILGFMAGTLTTISFVPQVYKVWRTRRSDDLSWGMLITFSVGVVLWLVYGLLLRAMPVIVANGFTLALLMMIGVLKARQRSRAVGNTAR